MNSARRLTRRLGAGLLGLALVACAAAPSPSPSIALAPTSEPTASPTAVATPSPTPEPTPEPYDTELLSHRFTVLVIGEDMSAARAARGYRGQNTDALMVVSVSPSQSRVVMLSLPRDTVDVPLGDGTVWHGKANGIASQLGLDRLRQAMGALLGIDVEYYVKINMDDFVTLVDAVGGVSVHVRTNVTEPRWGLYLTPGRAHLSGLQALYYSRARYYDSDYARAARQQQVVRSLVRKYARPETDVRIGALLRTLASLETNLDLAGLPSLVKLARRASRAKVISEVLSPPRFALAWGDQGDGRGWLIIPNVAEMQAYVRSLIHH
jgi:LCP family protein required for cell wall assembly